MIGILAEKPSAARNFAKALGGVTGTYNGESYKIVAARGHLYTFDDPEKQVPKDLADRYKKWNLENLPWNPKDFAWKRVPNGKDVKSLLNTLSRELSVCDEVCIATDNDPTGEGELIAWEIFDELGIHAKKFTRMYFLDESEKEVRRAFEQRKPIASMQSDMDFVKADFRSKWDYMSMQFTRIATAYGDASKRYVLRQGRLKSAMVLLVGNQIEARENYKRVPKYLVRFVDNNGVAYTDANVDKYDSREDVPIGNYHASSVVLDKTEMKHTAPPKLLDLAGLSSILAGRGIKAKEVLSVYQKMYENQIVSYPRTEDKKITPEQFNELLPLVDKIAAVVGIDLGKLTHRTPRKTHVASGGAHGANRPGLNVPQSLSWLDATYGKCASAIYELLAKNYLAMLAEDYEYERQSGHLADYPSFVGAVNIPKKRGFKDIFDDGDKDDEQSDIGLGTMANPDVFESVPAKPAKPTMKWLMKQLEKQNVGTGATRTSIYADVTNARSKYPLLNEGRGGEITMTDCGQMSYLLLPGTNIGDLKITERMFAQMDAIAKGEGDPNEFLEGIAKMVIEDIETMGKNAVTMRNKLGIKEAPPTEYVRGVFGSYGDIRFKRVFSGYRFTDEEVAKLLAGETIILRGLVGKSGKPFNCRGSLQKQSYKGHDFFGFKMDEFVND